jgi:hypothetical protein
MRLLRRIPRPHEMAVFANFAGAVRFMRDGIEIVEAHRSIDLKRFGYFATDFLIRPKRLG